MGASTSKHPSNRDGWNISLARSRSVPANSVNVEAESFNKSLWKSRPFSMQKSSMTGTDISNISILPGKQFGNALSLKSFTKLKPVIEEVEDLDYRDRVEPTGAQEIKEGLQNDFHSRQVATADSSEASKRRLLGRSVSFRPVQEAQVDLRSSVWRNCFTEDESGRETPSFLASTAKPTYSRASSFRNISSIDKSTGLRFLLSSDASSQNFASESKSPTLNKSLSLNIRVGNDALSGFRTKSCMSRSPSMRESTVARPEWMMKASALVESTSPLFDPSILASFEKAVEALSDYSEQSSDVSTSGFSGIVSSSPDIVSDADSPELLQASGANVESLDFPSIVSVREKGACVGAGAASQLRPDASYNKKLCFSKVSALDFRDWDGEVSLESFEMRCPPSGESKIVLYFTSLRGIRKTFEDCCTLRLILGGFRMHVDERDVWMHSKFRQELTEVLGVALSVPRLFIKGRYIGGAEEVKQLHEDGILGRLFDGLPTEWRKGCDVCGGVRFIPCTTCGGSCKIITEDDEKLRCPDCNENGLIMCPSCYW